MEEIRNRQIKKVNEGGARGGGGGCGWEICGVEAGMRR